MSRKRTALAGSLISWASLIVLWQLIVVLMRVKQYLLPAPIDVGRELLEERHQLLTNALSTVGNTALGFGVSVLVGLSLAVVITTSRTLQGVVYPMLVVTQVVPKIAVAPLFVVWLGYGATPKVLNAALISFFPVVINAVVGLATPDAEMLQLVRSMGASKATIFTKVRFPNAMPHVFSGLKVGITLAVVGTIVGEFVGGDSGLGYVILNASGVLNTPLLFAAIVLLTVIGLAAFYLIALTERVVAPWYVRSQEDDLVVATS